MSRKESEKEFHEYYLNSSLLFMKRGFAISILLFISFALVTQILFPEEPATRFFFRFGSIIPIMLFALVSVNIKSFRKHLHIILTFCAFISSVPIFFVGIFSRMDEPGYSYYFSWVLLVLVGSCTFYRIRLQNILIAGTLIILAYIFSILLNNNFSSYPFKSLNDLFFIVAMASIGYFISVSSYRLIYNNFIHKKEVSEYNTELENRITEINKIDSALKESQVNYRNLIDAIPDMIYVLDKDLRFVMLNESIKKIHTRINVQEKAIGMKITDIYNFATKERIKEIEDVFISGKEFVKEDMQVINGINFPVETRTIPVINDGKVVRVMYLF